MKTLIATLLVLTGLASANPGDTAVADTAAYRVDTCNGNRICRYVLVKIHAGNSAVADSVRAAHKSDSARFASVGAIDSVRKARKADSTTFATRADSSRAAHVADSLRANPLFSGTATVKAAGAGTPSALSGLAFQSYGTVAGYLQNNVQNLSNDTSASADWIVSTNIATDSTYYGDFGCNDSGFSKASWTVNGKNDCYVYAKANGKASVGGNLAIGTADSGKGVVIFTGGTLAANRRLVVTDTVAAFSVPYALPFRAITATKDTAHAKDAILGLSGATADTVQLLATVPGRIIRIKRTDGNNVAHLILGSIDGNSSYTMSWPYEAVELVAITSSTFALIGGR
jgi:hypothetical protein